MRLFSVVIIEAAHGSGEVSNVYSRGNEVPVPELQVPCGYVEMESGGRVSREAGEGGAFQESLEEVSLSPNRQGSHQTLGTHQVQ